MISKLGERLYSARMNCNLTRKQAAKLLRVSESLIGLYENGNRQPSLDTLIKLASLYKVSTDYLLGCEPNKYATINLSGLSDSQIQAITLTVNCFREQNAKK